MKCVRGWAALDVCVALACALMAASVARADEIEPPCTNCKQVVINEKGAYIHNEPNGRVIGWIKVGTEVYVLESATATWCKVLIENGPNAGNGGWAHCTDLGRRAMIVNEKRAYVHNEPNGRVIGWIKVGIEVYVLESAEATWCKVLIENGPNAGNGGWVLCTDLGRPVRSLSAQRCTVSRSRPGSCESARSHRAYLDHAAIWSDTRAPSRCLDRSGGSQCQWHRLREVSAPAKSAARIA